MFVLLAVNQYASLLLLNIILTSDLPALVSLALHQKPYIPTSPEPPDVLKPPGSAEKP
jgi:hypothetical protein